MRADPPQMFIVEPTVEVYQMAFDDIARTGKVLSSLRVTLAGAYYTSFIETAIFVVFYVL